MNTSRKVAAIVLAIAMVFTMADSITAETASAKAKPTYKLEISQKKNVVVAYKKVNGKWKYARTMLCSVGTFGRTPNGTFSLGRKYRWGYLMGDCWGQYCSVINGSVWFHSVWYYNSNKHSQNATEYAKLGRAASHGCVRMATIDVKWVYDNCKRGTKVKIARDVRAPKGKPKRIGKVVRGWDPTDPDKRNPNFKLKKIRITAKGKTVGFKKSYDLMKGVSAYNPNALQDLSGNVKVKVYTGGKWKSAKKLPTRKTGKVKVKYSVSSPYAKDASKTVTFNVVDNGKPTITAKNRTVEIGDTNAVQGVSAKQKDGTKRTGAITVTITDPDGEVVAENISYSKAKIFVFEKAGKYKVTYKVANKTYVKKVGTKTITITVNDVPQEEQPGEGKQ